MPDLEQVREIRATDPEAIARAAAHRRRRPLLPADGRLLLIAADHPARGALGVRDVPDAMASRTDLIDRLITALQRPGVDGVLATPDVLEDLLLLGVLDGRVAVASMNRGGLAGASFELDDRFTAADPASIATAWDGGKMLCRIDLSDPGTVRTLEACGRVIGELTRQRQMALVEPFWSTRRDGAVVNDLDPAAVIRAVHIAQGLGPSSAYTWLKLPVVEDMERVMTATTLPTLLLGGDPSGRPDDTYAGWQKALAAPGIRGLVVGRSLLYPPGDDVAAAVDTAVGLVRTGNPAGAPGAEEDGT